MVARATGPTHVTGPSQDGSSQPVWVPTVAPERELVTRRHKLPGTRAKLVFRDSDS
jgi:hypothetical protein